MVDVQGSCDARFERVREAFAANFERMDVGASAVVMVDGEVVADLWGGHLDVERTQPWQEDTIINVFSTTKTMCNLSALVLADRGELDLDAPVARYWPEYGANGKEGVLVRHFLAHTAGAAGWDQKIDTETLYDWDRACALLAEQAPWWEPGSKSGYHGLTQGYLVGEVVRRVTGTTIGTFFRDEVAKGADFHIGLGAEHDARVAPVIPAPPLADAVGGGGGDRTSIAWRSFANPKLEASSSFTIPWRRAEIPAAGGHGNARSVAAVQHRTVLSGEAGLLSPATQARICEVQAAGRDLVLGIGVTFGIGYGLNSARAPIAPNERVFYWGGWGGSLVVNDLDARMTMAYVMNKMGEGTVGDDRAHTILRAAYASLG